MARKPDGLITTNARVLKLIYENPTISYAELAEEVGVHETTIRQRLEELEAQGFLSRTRPDRRNLYTVDLERPIAPDLDARVEALLDLLGARPPSP